jgi:putative peptidoglycan lipid II flippase
MKVNPAEPACVETTARSTVRNTLLVAALVLVGRFSGFVREWMIAAQGGATEATDVAIVLLTFPDLMVSLLLGGGLAATLVPAFRRSPRGEDAALFIRAMLWIGGGFVLLAIVLGLAAPLVLGLLAPGLSEGVRAANIPSFLVMLLALPLSALSGVVVAFLNAHGRFAVGAGGTLFFNGMVIVCVALAGKGSIAFAIAVGVAVGALLRLTVQGVDAWPVFGRVGLANAPRMAGLLKQFAGTFSFVTVLVALSPISRAISSFHDAGALSLFNYASKLVDLPMGVLIGAIGTVLLPRIAGDFETGGYGGARPALLVALKAVVWASMAIVVPAVFFPDVLVGLAFFGAAFTPVQTSLLADLVTIAFLSLPFQAALSIYGTAFAAAGAMRPLLKVALLMLLATLMFSPLALAQTGVRGVMAVYVGVYVIGAVAMARQAAAVARFGSGLTERVLGGARMSLLWPVLAAAAIALVGDSISTEFWTRAGWAAAAFAGFAVVAAGCNPGLWRQLMSRGKEGAR